MKQLTNTIKFSPNDKKKEGTICYFTVSNHQLTKQAIRANAALATHPALGFAALVWSLEVTAPALEGLGDVHFVSEDLIL